MKVWLVGEGYWGKKISVIDDLSIWLEQWAKAGAGPNFRVENVSEYISNIKWGPVDSSNNEYYFQINNDKWIKNKNEYLQNLGSSFNNI